MSYVTLAIARSPFFPVFSQARFGCSCCEIRYLARNKIEPFEKEVRTFGSSYFHGSHVGSESVGERANNTVDFKRARYVDGLYFQRLLLLPLAPHSRDRKQC